MIRIADSVKAIRDARRELSGRVGVVPTMGALHKGHLELVRQARVDNDHVITTIFVNPTQFGPNEDLDAYPRDLDGDIARLETEGVDIVFMPNSAVMYPSGYQTYISVEQVTQGLEGEHRPGHFRGVTTVVAKLFNLTQPDTAYFGQKDAQQVVVIRRMVADLNFPLQISVVPTAREPDGLAMSSRNAYLSPEERKAAPALNRALSIAGSVYMHQTKHPRDLRQVIERQLSMESLGQVEYISIADTSTLEELETPSSKPILVSLVVRFGKTRLLDNRLLPLNLNNRAGLTKTLGSVERK